MEQPMNNDIKEPKNIINYVQGKEGLRRRYVLGNRADYSPRTMNYVKSPAPLK